MDKYTLFFFVWPFVVAGILWLHVKYILKPKTEYYVSESTLRAIQEGHLDHLIIKEPIHVRPNANNRS